MINEYLSYLANIKMYAANTIKRYAVCLRAFAVANQGNRWSAIQRTDVERFLASLSCAASTKANYLSVLRGFFSYLVHHRGLPANPCKYISSAKIRNRVPDVLPMSVIGNVIRKQSSTAVQLAILLMARMGLRVCEVLALRKSDIIDGRAKIHGKGGKERYIFVPSYVQTRIDRIACNDLLFEDWDDRAFRKAIWLAFHMCGVETHPHALRHSFASALANSGMPLNQLALLMGHESVKTTERYLHCASEQVKQNYLSIL